MAKLLSVTARYRALPEEPLTAMKELRARYFCREITGLLITEILLLLRLNKSGAGRKFDSVFYSKRINRVNFCFNLSYTASVLKMAKIKKNIFNLWKLITERNINFFKPCIS